VTIGGITITPEIIEELNALVNDYGVEHAKNVIAENCLYINSLHSEDCRQVDTDFWAILNVFYRMLSALSKQQEGGAQ